MTTPLSSAPTATDQAAVTPAGALQRLRDGNVRFVTGETAARDHLADVASTADGQHPWVAIVGCIDSRVLPELAFDLGVGDAFVARTAGNVVDVDVLGSLEFATAVAGAKAVVVLGHERCGAVIGACDGVELGNLTDLLGKIRPAVDDVAGDAGGVDSSDASAVSRVVARNVEESLSTLRARSEVLAAAESDGSIVLAGAVYDVADGTVRWLD